MANEGRLLQVDIRHEMKKCYIDYAMSVIVGSGIIARMSMSTVRSGIIARERPSLVSVFMNTRLIPLRPRTE
jgi:hypothetical protein